MEKKCGTGSADARPWPPTPRVLAQMAASGQRGPDTAGSIRTSRTETRTGLAWYGTRHPNGCERCSILVGVRVE